MNNAHYPLNAKKIAAWVIIIAVVVVVYIATATARDTPDTAATDAQSRQSTNTDNPPAAESGDTMSTTPTETLAGGTTTPATIPAPAAPASSPYKDGSYTTTANYRTPEGSEFVTVTLTLTGGTISGSSISLSKIDFESRRYQGQFENGYKAVVVGQPIADLNLRRVSGSSLTTAAFNNALDTIRSQAQS